MGNKRLLIIGAVLVIVALLGGAIFLFVGKNKTKKEANLTSEEQAQNVKTVSSQDLGLTLSPRADKKAINLTITKLAGIASVEYEVSYDAEVAEGGGKLTVPRGVTNSPIEIKPGDTKITREVELGTCSRNVCKYDKVISDVKFVLKVNFADGTVGSLEERVSL